LVNLSSFEKTGSNPSYSKNQFPSNQNFSLGDKNPNIRISGFNGLNQNSERVVIQPLETPTVGLSTKYDNGTLSASKLNAVQTGLDLLRSSGYGGVPIGEMIYGTANSIFNLLTNIRTQGSINLDGSYPFDNERRENIMNAWMLLGTLPMGGVAAEAKAATQATTMETFAEEGSFSISNWTGYPTEGIRPTGPFRVLIGE